MPGAVGEIFVQLLHDRNGRWQVVPLSVGPDIVLEMLPNPTSSESSISRQTRDRLVDSSYLQHLTGNRYVLSELAVVGQRLADLEVRVSPGPALLGVDGILGRSFFQRFTSIVWQPRREPDTDQLRLYDP